MVATLIAIVTFAAFMVPGGFNQNGNVGEGLVVLSKITDFRVFLVANTLGFDLSTTSVFVHVLAQQLVRMLLTQKNGTTYCFLHKLVYWSNAGHFYCMHLYNGATL